VLDSRHPWVGPAAQQLLTQYIVENTKDRALANRTVDAIRAYIASMNVVPHRGTQRDDLRPGLRVVPFKKRTAIASEIDENKQIVTILRVFCGGQDYAAILNSARQRKSVKPKN
jgi:toxin ParE1/3/4